MGPLFYVFLLIIGVVAVGVYLAFILTQVPGAAEERLGVLEPLPENLGKWMADNESDEAKAALADGLKREVRVLHEPKKGLFGADTLVTQARLRDRATNEIVRIEPERRAARKRVKARVS
jgi:hypothetical protein